MKKLTFKRPVHFCLLFLIVSCASGPQLKVIPFAENDKPILKLALVSQDIETAKTEGVNLLSPTWFGRAESSYLAARKMYADGKTTRNVLEKLSWSRAELSRASEMSKVSRVILQTVIQARYGAMQAGAQTDTEEFREAEKEMIVLAGYIENDKRRKAEKNQIEVVQMFKDIELAAIKRKALKKAEAALGSAMALQAEDHAPKTFVKAKKAFKETNTYIEKNRYDKKEIEIRAEQARFLAERARTIAAQTQEIKRETPEQTALRMEGMIHSIGSKLEPKDNRNRPVLAQVNQIQSLIEKFIGDKGALKGEKIALNSQVKDLEARTREDELRIAALKREKEFNKKFDLIQGWFTPEEAEVYKEGNVLVIRLKSIKFPSGKFTLVENTYPLLRKVHSAIQVFEIPDVIIEGHTDSVGNKEANMRLSEQRAQVVRGYFVTHGTIRDPNIHAVGFGFERPIATNKTKEGRAINRRIDVRIQPQYKN